MDQEQISSRNSSFWDELCGSQLAKSLGVTDDSTASLKRFDDWYFDFYPYLFDHIPFQDLSGKDVLEVGLGYGTVAERLALSGCRYTGLDIARGPVDMANHRLRQNDLPGRALLGSILDAPFCHPSFDVVVAIGSLHHTGNLQLAIRQCHALLRPGGQLIFMVYSAYSYRRWRMARRVTLGYLLRELQGHRNVVGATDERERAAYDAGSDGQGAPHTDFISRRSLKSLCSVFTDFTARLENIDQEPPFSKAPRKVLVKTRWPQLVGLDIYATATK